MKFFARISFSRSVGLALILLLSVFWAWFTIYRPSIGESRRIEAIVAEFKSHGCRSIHAQNLPLFEGHWLLKYLKLEKKTLRQLHFGFGSEVPRSFLRNPSYLPDLQMLGFLDSNPGDEELIWALNIPSLRYLTIEGEHRISWKGFRGLLDRKEPLCLSLIHDDRIEGDLANLALFNPPALNSLLIGNCSLNDRCFDSLSKLKSLDQLAMTECTGLSSSGFERIGHLPVVSLLIRDSAGISEELDDEALEAIVRMPELVQLAIPYRSRVSVRGWDCLKSSPKLLQVLGLPPEREDEFEEFFRRRLESLP